MPKTIISVDLQRPASEQPTIHTRWHPDIPVVAEVDVNEVFRVECLDCTGGQIVNTDNADDLDTTDWGAVHHISGPIEVRGAEPGDLLVVDILDIGPLPGSEWGYSGIIDQKIGGFLWERFPNPAKAIWEFEGIYAVSRHVPKVRFPGMIHPGVLGCAPSHELLKQWNKREKELVDTDPNRVPPLAILPHEGGTLLGKIKKGTPEWEKIAKEAVRTIPPRENGGNCDIKNLSKGSRAYLPIFVPGAKLSMGDIHFSQGDGEIALCGGIEMAGWIDLKVSLIKGGMKMYDTPGPMFISGPAEPKFSKYLVFEGISVDESGKQHYMDATLSYRQACLKAIKYLTKFGYTEEQAVFIITALPCEGRISAIVDIPNAMCTLGLPVDAFEFDITPSGEGPKVIITSPHASCTHKKTK